MPVVCNIAGFLCLLYFILLLVYSGFTCLLFLIWVLMLLGRLFRIRFFQHLPVPVRVGMILFLSVCLLFFLSVEAMILKGALTMPAEPQDYVIVLGAHVRSTGPSRALALRLDKAYEYVLEHPGTIIIVSGGQGSNEPCTESSAMKQYLMEKGRRNIPLIPTRI